MLTVANRLSTEVCVPQLHRKSSYLELSSLHSATVVGFAEATISWFLMEYSTVRDSAANMMHMYFLRRGARRSRLGRQSFVSVSDENPSHVTRGALAADRARWRRLPGNIERDESTSVCTHAPVTTRPRESRV